MVGRIQVLILAAAWGVGLIGLFLLNRRYDLPHLLDWLVALARELTRSTPVGSAGLVRSAGGVILAAFIVVAWWGLGSLIVRLIAPRGGLGARALDWGARGLLGSAAWSTVWFFLGVAGLYRTPVAVAAVGVGTALAFLTWQRGRWSAPVEGRRPGTAVVLIVIVLGLALLAALAPPTGNDALLYHLALPKVFVSTGALVVAPDNIASYFALGVEMHAVWALLLGVPASQRLGEATAGAMFWVFAVLVVLVTYGWARERRLDRSWSTLAALTVAAIPSVYFVTAGQSVDVAVAGYSALAIFAVGRWWVTLDSRWLLLMAAGVGAALSSKLTAAALILPLVMVVLLRGLTAGAAPGGFGARGVVATGLGGLGLGILLASPWYIRNWIMTGSPIFPFFPTVWPGDAPGWDVGRARLYEALLTIYGRSSTAFDYLLSPFYVSIAAQPELPRDYDGVLGVTFLLGAPVVAWAFRRRLLDVELRLAALVSVAMFVLWLLGSQVLRYLLLAMPPLAVVIAAAAAAASAEYGPGVGRLLRGLLLGAAAANALVVVAWFAELDPLQVVLGGESRERFLARRLDYYAYYQVINRTLPPDARIWLISTRRDTYHLERPYFADYLFGDYTLNQWIRETRDATTLQARARALGVTHLLIRHDVLFDSARSVLVDESGPREENLTRLELLRALLTQETRLVMGGTKFWLIELPRS